MLDLMKSNDSNFCCCLTVQLLTANIVLIVSAAANGLEAWKILQDPNNHSDLVLTEVVMPILSGFGLLCKIMSHRTLRNIPVISEYHFSFYVLIFVVCEALVPMIY